MTGPKEIANSKSRCSVKHSTSHQISAPAPRGNITNHRNGMPWMDYPRRNEIPGAWNMNTIAWLPVTPPSNMMNPFNTGYQRYCPNIQWAEDNVIHTPFSAKNWIRQSQNYNFIAVPYNSNIFRDHRLGYSPANLVYPGMLTDSPGVAQWKCNWWLGYQNQVALNSNPCPQGVHLSQIQSYSAHYQIRDELTHMVVSPTKVKGEIKVKNDRSPFLRQQSLPLVITCPGDKNENIENDIAGLISPIQPETFQIEEKITESSVTSEEVYDGLPIPKTWGGLTKDNPNPNGRGRSVSVISEISSTTSFESKRAELIRDSMILRTPSEHAPSVKTIKMTSSPTSQRSLSDKTSVSDFVLKSKGLSESNCEVRESFHQKLVTSRELSPKLLSNFLVSKPTQLPVPEYSLKSKIPIPPPMSLSEVSSKVEVPKPLSFNVESASRKEDECNVISPKKKRKNYEWVTAKSYKPSSLQVLEIPEPHTSPRARKKSQKPKEIKNKRKPNKEMKEECGPHNYSKNQVPTKKQRQSTCDIFKDYLIRVIKSLTVMESRSPFIYSKERH